MEAAEHLSETPIDSLQAGDLLGRYQLLCPIARGGMGQVWAARQTGRLGLPKIVAIKTALPLSSTSYDAVQRFLFDEAQVAASIDHPNVCKMLELGQDGGVLFIAMEWLHGAPLSTLVNGMPHRRFDVRLAAHIVAEACRGLHAAHELRDDEGVPLEVVHRDATPHNLLVTAAGEVKVMDFGIVKSRNQQHQATQTGELKGKISYLAPEQIRGKDVDRRADIFTLGCVLYVTTTGKSPFSAPDPGTTILRILEGDYASPSALVADYPPELERIVTRALAKDPAERFQSADELRLALEAFAKDLAPVTREEIAALLNQYCGAKIEQRRSEIRAAQKLFDSQNGGPASSGTYPTGDIRTWENGTPSVSRVLASTAAPSDTGNHPTPLVPAGPTPVVPALAPRSRRGRIAVAATGVVLAAVAAIGLMRGFLPLDRASTAALPAATLPAAAPTASSIEISVRTNPVNARLRIDDGPELETPHAIVIAADDRSHTLHVRAEGYEPSSHQVRFDRNQSLVFELLPEASTPAKSRRSPKTASRAPRVPAPPSAAPGPNAGVSVPEPAPRASVPTAKTSEPQLRARPRHTIDESDPFGSTP